MQYNSVTLVNASIRDTTKTICKNECDVVYNTITPDYPFDDHSSCPFLLERVDIDSAEADPEHIRLKGDERNYLRMYGQLSPRSDTIFDLNFFFSEPVDGVQIRLGGTVTIPTTTVQISPTTYAIKGLDVKNQLNAVQSFASVECLLKIPKTNTNFINGLSEKNPKVKVGATYGYWHSSIRELLAIIIELYDGNIDKYLDYFIFQTDKGLVSILEGLTNKSRPVSKQTTPN